MIDVLLVWTTIATVSLAIACGYSWGYLAGKAAAFKELAQKK